MPERTIRRVSRVVRGALALALCTSILVGLAQPALAEDIVRIGRDASHGWFAQVLAEGSVQFPNALFVKVRARPNQTVDVSWSLTCHDEGNSRNRRGAFSAVTPVKRRLRIPYADAEECFVRAEGVVRNRGRIILILLARVPTRRVTYSVSGSTATVDLTYVEFDLVQVNGVPVPWTYSFDAVEGAFLKVSAKKDGSSGDVTCSISVDGVLLQSNTSTGAFALCTASETL